MKARTTFAVLLAICYIINPAQAQDEVAPGVNASLQTATVPLGRKTFTASDNKTVTVIGVRGGGLKSITLSENSDLIDVYVQHPSENQEDQMVTIIREKENITPKDQHMVDINEEPSMSIITIITCILMVILIILASILLFTIRKFTTLFMHAKVKDHNAK